MRCYVIRARTYAVQMSYAPIKSTACKPSLERLTVNAAFPVGLIRQKCRGHSLIELTVTLCIMVTLGGYALSGYLSVTEGSAVDKATDNLVAIIRNARTSALILHSPVIICPLDPSFRSNVNQASPTLICGPRDTWHLGTVAFADVNGDLLFTDDEFIIGTGSALEQTIRIRWKAFRNRSYLRFTAQGLTDWQNGRFNICSTVSAHSREITINSAGRIFASEASLPSHEPSAAPAQEC